MDRISKLPTTIIEIILCLVPIQEAARTSILAKEWRYHWTKIPKLAFHEDTFQVSSYGDELSALEKTKKGMAKRCRLLYAINQVLLKHEGPIDEFTLSMIPDKTCVEMDNIISYLSKNKAVKKLELGLVGYKLPSSFFTFDHLTDLYLGGCDLDLDHQPTFKGFYNLTNLCMEDVATDKSAFLHFLSSCPLIKSLTLDTDDILAMERFAQNGVPRMLPSPLAHLKYLYIDYMDLQYGLPFILLLIRSSPNLETLKLHVTYVSWFVDYEKRSCTQKDYPDMWLPCLNKFEIFITNSEKLLLDFIKLILATSPVLKKAKISLRKDIDEQKVSRIILSSQRASPVVDILVEKKDCAFRGL